MRAIGCGDQHTAVLLVTGDVYAAGSNEYGACAQGDDCPMEVCARWGAEVRTCGFGCHLSANAQDNDLLARDLHVGLLPADEALKGGVPQQRASQEIGQLAGAVGGPYGPWAAGRKSACKCTGTQWYLEALVS